MPTDFATLARGELWELAYLKRFFGLKALRAQIPKGLRAVKERRMKAEVEPGLRRCWGQTYTNCGQREVPKHMALVLGAVWS